MKCNSKKAMDEKYWNLSLKFAVDNLKTALVTLHRDFGFGPERLKKFLDGVVKTAAKYNEAFADEVMDDVINEDVANLGIPDEYLEMLCSKRYETRAEYHCANRERKNLSVREAAAIADKLQGLKAFQQDTGIIPGGRNERI